MANVPLLQADWPAPAHVHAVVTTRAGGVSTAPWDSLNLGTHVDDNPADVAQNRARLQQALCSVATCMEPQWLNQVHGIRVLEASADTVLHASGALPAADAVTTTVAGLPCVVMTADCLPVFFCDRAGTRVAVAHAGWRGLCDGVLEATVQTFADPAQVMAWMGPAIGPSAFEVGEEVREAFVAKQADAARAFVPSPNAGRWLADIYLLARLRLSAVGVMAVSGGGRCTFTEGETFFSYRRDGRTGRMASVIWLSGA
ncbi:MAG: peptidoglycan editing factor PgeF [Moraxellaceae bacterium]|nr:peptidoglycan editing factor PgeF [Moraxellaceae bacterium]